MTTNHVKHCEELDNQRLNKMQIVFFEMEPAGELPIVLKRREPRKALYKHIQLCTRGQKPDMPQPLVTSNHMCNNKLEICFAPAIAHKPASSLIFWRRCIGADSLRSKILTFLSFHTSQQTRTIMKRILRLTVEGAQSRFSHQVCTKSPSTQAEGHRCSLPSHIAMPSQMRIV
jgi:hypothetical protein